MKISLREWIATGKFGEITNGATRAEVCNCIGEAPNWGVPTTDIETAEIWKYGDIEFYFSGDLLWMIFTDDFEIPRGCEAFELDAWEIKRDCTLTEMECHLSEAGIVYRVEDFPYADNGVRLICQRGATLTFCGEDAAQLELRAVSNSRSS